MEEDYTFFDLIFDKKEEKIYDVSHNNLDSIQYFIEFFEDLNETFNNDDEISIQKYLGKLNYLGYTFNGETSIRYDNVNSIKNAIIQFAFLRNLENNKQVKICFLTCLDLLKCLE